MHYQKQIERNAIAAYVLYGLRLRVPLSSGARRELKRLRRSTAALSDMQAAHDHKPRAFVTRACLLPAPCECVMCTRNRAYRMQQRRELIAELAAR